MLTEAAKQLARRFYEEALNTGNLALLDQILAQDFVDHSASGDDVTGVDAFKSFLSMVTGAFPDLHIHVEDMFGEGNKVAVRLAVHGTHKGTLMGSIRPTGKRAAWTGIDLLQMEGGKIVARWSERNLLGLMQQLGVVSLPGS
jgi:steroid delta-isomerase-like uncharacterized protein